jgi:membrane associated rhomboid family serine protease
MSVRHSSGPSPWSQFKITRGAGIILAVSVIASLAYLLCDLPLRAQIQQWAGPTGSSVWREGKVWTLLTGPLLETRFISLIMQAFVIWSFVPTMERHWGTARLLRFAIMTSVAGTVGGTLVGFALGSDIPIFGVDPFVYATIVAFGVLYAKQPVRFFGAIPMTGQQMAIGILGFLFLFVLLQSRWEHGGALVAAIAMALFLTSRKYNPRILYKRWQLRRARSHLSLVPNQPSDKGAGRGGKGKTDERWIN